MERSEILYWFAEIKACEDRQRKDLIEKNCYPDMIRYYEGKLIYNPSAPDSRDKEHDAVINEFFPNTNSIIADIMYKFPEVAVEAKKEEAELTADLMKAAIEYAVRKTEALDESRLALFDMIYAGFSALEVGHMVDGEGYTAQTDMAQPEPNGGVLGQVKEFIGKFTGGTEQATAQKVEADYAPPEERYGTTEKTYVRRLDPLNVLLDYRAERIKDMRYIIKKVTMSKTEFDNKYPEFADKVQDNSSGRIDYASHANKDHCTAITVYEIQVRKKGGVYTNICLTLGVKDQALKEYDRPFVTEGFDIKIGTFHKYGRLYPVSIARVNKYINDRQNSYTRYMMEVAERTVPKIVAVGEVSEKAKEAILGPRVNDLIELDKGTQIAGIEYGKVSNENKELLQIFAQAKEKLWSVSESRLAGKSTSEFATEINIQEAGFQSRQGDLQEGLRDVLQQVLGEIKDIIKQLWDGEYFFKVTGKEMPEWYASQTGMVDGQPLTVNPLTDELIGDYDVTVDITSSMRPNKEKKKKDMTEFLAFMMSEPVTMMLQANGLQLDANFLKKSVQEYGYNPEVVFAQAAPMMPPMPQEMPVEEPLPVEGVPSASVPIG